MITFLAIVGGIVVVSFIATCVAFAYWLYQWVKAGSR